MYVLYYVCVCVQNVLVNSNHLFTQRVHYVWNTHILISKFTGRSIGGEGPDDGQMVSSSM